MNKQHISVKIAILLVMFFLLNSIICFSVWFCNNSLLRRVYLRVSVKNLFIKTMKDKKNDTLKKEIFILTNYHIYILSESWIIFCLVCFAAKTNWPHFWLKQLWDMTLACQLTRSQDLFPLTLILTHCEDAGKIYVAVWNKQESYELASYS